MITPAMPLERSFRRRSSGGWFQIWSPIIVLPAVALAARGHVPAWFFMWLFALSIYWGCKWLTWRRALRPSLVPRFAGLRYLAGWLGMDPSPFLESDRRPLPSPTAREWMAAAAKTTIGVLLILRAARLTVSGDAMVGGLPTAWVGMIGTILALHFGSFQLIALAWRRSGFDVQPLMREPLRSVSLGEFWGRRWNAAFHALVQGVAFRPLARRVGSRSAAMAVFLISGLVHDAVISVPAGGGYGLPTAYFLIQGAAALFERGPVGRFLGLGHGWRGWVFTMAVTAGPVMLLFHSAFVRNVILPMLRAIPAW